MWLTGRLRSRLVGSIACGDRRLEAAALGWDTRVRGAPTMQGHGLWHDYEGPCDPATEVSIDRKTGQILQDQSRLVRREGVILY